MDRRKTGHSEVTLQLMDSHRDGDVSATPPQSITRAESGAASTAGSAKPGKMTRMGSWGYKDESELKPAYFSFRNINCTLPVKGVDKQLLKDVSGYCKPGETLAIMGPSGAGKSTLMDVLSFRKTTGTFSQDVMLNGETLTKRAFIKHNGYVTSDDLLPPEFTVREALEFCAALRLPPDWTPEQRNARIEDVLSVMHLKYVENNRIGSNLVRGLSTGERKRVNVAVELLPVASVVFLDEPTTGLDSNTGKEIIENCVEVVKMRKLACIASIHQPSHSILSQFDNLLLLANGKMCYFGKTEDCIRYFEEYLKIPVHGNPAEIFADAQAAMPDKLIEAWEASDERALLVKTINSIHTGQGSVSELKKITEEENTLADKLGFYQQASGFEQIKQLLTRQMKIYIRNPTMSTSRFLAAFFTALFFGLAFLQLERNFSGSAGKVNELFALKLMTPGFGSAAIAYWLEKRKAYYHEEAAGFYHKLNYLIVNFITEFVFLSLVMAICAIVTFTLSSWLTEFLGHYIFYFVIEAFAVTGWNSLCAFMSASIPYANAAFTVHYFWGILLASYYLTDNFLFTRPGGSLFQNFLVWTAYPRGAFIPIMRHEFYGQELRCTESEKFNFDTTGLTAGGISDASLNLTMHATNNQSIISTIRSFGVWEKATEAQNATVKRLYTLASNLYNAAASQQILANITALPVGDLTGLKTLVNTELATEAVAFAQYALVNVSDAVALNDSLTKLLTASSMVFFADYLKVPANNLGPSPVCLYPDGNAFLSNYVQHVMTNPDGTKGFDHPDVTPSYIYVLDNIAQGLVMFTLAFLCLRSCNFRQK